MKKFIKEHYYIHLLVGGLLGYLMGQTFSGVPLIIQIFLVLFVSGAIGTLWEWLWASYGKAKVDYTDVLFGVIGAMFTYILTCFL